MIYRTLDTVTDRDGSSVSKERVRCVVFVQVVESSTLLEWASALKVFKLSTSTEICEVGRPQVRCLNRR